MKKIIFLLSTIGIFLFACKNTKQTTQSKKDANMPKLEWSIVKAGNMGSEDAVKTILIKSDAEWQKEWAQTNRRFEPVPVAPEADFTTHWIIGYHLGMRSNGGYNVGIKDIQRANGEIVVSVVEKAPGKNCMNSEVITRPYVYVKIAHFSEAKLNYKAEKEIKDCR